MLLKLFGLYFLFSYCVLCSVVARSTLTTSLNSGWSVSPIELQFSEWIAQRGSSCFWQFIQDLFQREQHLDSDQESFAWCEDWIARHWDVASGQVAVWSVLAVEQLGSVVSQNRWAHHIWYHSQSTKVLQDKPIVFAEWNNQLYIDLDSLIVDLQGLHESTELKSDPQSFLNIDTGHCYCPSVRNGSLGVSLVILYGHVGRKEMKPWHDFLFSMANDGHLCYVIRHSYLSTNRSMYLQGYGVEVFMKNTEYWVQDPQAYPCVKTEQRNDTFDISTISDKRCWSVGDCYLAGIDWPALVDHYSLSRDDEFILQNALDDWEQSRCQFKEWKPWQVGEIGLSATHVIVHSKDPLCTLERIANNIPLYAPLLAGPWRLSDSQVDSYREILQSLEDWEEQVILNGRSLSLPWGLLPPTLTHCMDAITLARNVWSKGIAHQSNLSGMRIDDHLWNVTSSTTSIRLSLIHPDSPVVFIQNEDDISSILKDTKMSTSSSSAIFYEYAAYLRSLDRLSPSQLVDVIFLWDPLDANQLMVVEWIKEVLEQRWPIRIGIGWIPSSTLQQHRDGQGDDHHRYSASSAVDWNSYLNKDSTSEPRDILWYHLASHSFPKRKMSLMEEKEEEDEAMIEIMLKALEYLTTQVPCPIAAYYFMAKLKQKITVPMDIFTLLAGGGGMASYEKLQWDHLQEAFLFAYSRSFSCSFQESQQESDISVAKEIWKQWTNSAMIHSYAVKRNRQWANALGLQSFPTVVINGIPLGDITSQLIATLEQEMKEILNPAASSHKKWIPRQNTRLHGQGVAPYNPNTLHQIVQYNEYHSCKYFHTMAAQKNSVGLSTIWIAVDLESLQGLKRMALALEWLTCPLSIPARVAFLSSSRITTHSSNTSDQQDPIQQMKQLVMTQMKKVKGQEDDLLTMNNDSFEFLSYIPEISEQWIQKYQVFINGFGYSSHLFTFPTDFDLACAMMDNAGLSLEDADMQLLWSFTSHWLDQSCSLSFSRPGSQLFSSSPTLRMNEWKQLLGESFDLLSFHHTFLTNTSETGKYDTSVFHVKAVLDPLSPHAAKAATMLSMLRKHFDISISVLLLPHPYTPIETIRKASFYRTVLVPRPRFESNTGALISKPSGVFTTLFKNRTLTVSMDTPPKWLIGASHANEDLDNLVIQNDTQVLYAEYQLEAILVEGICIDVSNLSSFAPQGLTLSLVPWTSDSMQTQDTLVMANLGYFQFQTHFGIWNLQVGQRQGMSYELVKVEESNIADTTASIASSIMLGLSASNIIPQSALSHLFLCVNQLQGKTLTLYVRPSTFAKVESRLPAVMSNWLSKLLDSTQLFSWWNSQQQQTTSDDRMIHVFSVASGYLYERLIRIMMLSVVKHSSVPVKFWLLKNYLSPSFKKVLPHFASTCGFDYQLVTYRWPAWLTAQTEKQRIMWAYKILFLDVLFPLNLSKVVFIDSDQVVRGDLYELFQLDLHGAPYGYVPFCDSRKEVEGYRFWKQGFWASLLKDQKYRISALYVVDLKKFRKMAAGDNLRAIYQRLAQDPASLSNLDQDLPNFASVPQPGLPHVPIYDLPPEWLWCETWCDDESKKRAKTIDLCNNPMTKEHKLSSARRIIPEWNALDKEATEIVSQALCPSSSAFEKTNENILKANEVHEEL
ncbi:hypothetical protein GpartN1_g889.t1 [Galdieria partita]|uniref:UDP-glucose:glycoprotein glucosyltransferase n=1 Tax=Galdieria partita TaxID=83374 RepID=A0A9C7UMX9_9RHOD|nr:hypothetical protein GpartN1_g889.t1 [Galdieria partita]